MKSIYFQSAVILIVFGVLIFYSTKSTAHPKFAARDGVTCSRCHVAEQGGGLRNEYGAGYYSQDVLPAIPWDEFGNENFTGAISEFIRAGADVRVQYFRYDENGATQDAFFPMQADIYLGVTPSEQLTFYYEQSLFRTVASTDLWARLDILNGNASLLFGQFTQDYGLKLDDHTSFIRGGNDGSLALNSDIAGIPGLYQGLHWKPDNNTVGISLTYKPNDWKLAGSVGKPAGMEVYSTTLNLSRAFWIGAMNAYAGLSMYHGSYYRQLDPYTYYGAYAGVGLGPLTVLGEVDIINDYPVKNQSGLVTYAEATLQIAPGLYLALEHDYFDADRENAADELTRYTIGAEWFPISYVEIKPQYRVLDVSASPDYSQSEAILQVHFWF